MELGIEMAYFQQPGSFQCRHRYKMLECMYAFPKCRQDKAVIAPCRSDCKKFVAECPGADVQCKSYPLESEEQCLHLDHENVAGRAAAASRFLASAVIAVTGAVVALGF